MKIQATDVFVPGAYPTRTYIERTDKGLEKTLADALATPGQTGGPFKPGVGLEWGSLQSRSRRSLRNKTSTCGKLHY